MQAGIFSNDAAAIADFIRVAKAETCSAGSAKRQLIVRPENEPRIAIAVEDRQNSPISSSFRPDGSFAVVAGEIYNKNEIVSTAREDHSSHNDDAEIILDLYFSSGPESLARLNGAAIITIWDAGWQNLTIYRDRWGQASQFYSEDPKRLLWSADLRTLLLLGVPADIDPDALDFFLAAGYFPAPWTGLLNVKKIPPAHALNCRKVGTVEVQRFWRGTGKPKIEMPPEEVTERLQTLLQQSLRRRYEPGGKTGVFLSGGVDSTLLVGALTKLIGADVESFTFHYSNYEGPFNENPLAQAATKHFGTRHHTIEFTPSDLATNLDRMVLGYEEPFTYGLHTYFLKDVLQTETSSIMSGAGVGDWYAGKRDLFARRIRKLSLPYNTMARLLGPPLSTVKAGWGPPVRNLLFGAASGLPDKANAPVIPDAIRSAIYQDPRRSKGLHRLRGLLRGVVADMAGESDGDQIALLTQRYFIAECNLYWYTRWGSTWNVNIRHPYYDNDLQEFAMRLPKLDHDKPEMRRLAARFMPHSMAYAPKLAQTVPIREWFRGPLVELLRSRLSADRLKKNGIFDPAAVQRLIDQHVNREGNYEWPLWTILTTTVWQEVVLKTQPA